DDDISDLADVGSRMPDILQKLLRLRAESNPVPVQVDQDLDRARIISHRGWDQDDRLSSSRRTGRHFLRLLVAFRQALDGNPPNGALRGRDRSVDPDCHGRACGLWALRGGCRLRRSGRCRFHPWAFGASAGAVAIFGPAGGPAAFDDVGTGSGAGPFGPATLPPLPLIGPSSKC